MIRGAHLNNILNILLEMKSNIIGGLEPIIINLLFDRLDHRPIITIQKDMYKLILINSFGHKFLNIKVISANDIRLNIFPGIRQILEPLELWLLD